MSQEIHLDDDQGTVEFKYVAILENLSYGSRNEADFMKKMQSKEEIKEGDVRLYPIDITDTKHFREW